MLFQRRPRLHPHKRSLARLLKEEAQIALEWEMCDSSVSTFWGAKSDFQKITFFGAKISTYRKKEMLVVPY